MTLRSIVATLQAFNRKQSQPQQQFRVLETRDYYWQNVNEAISLQKKFTTSEVSPPCKVSNPDEGDAR
jgi:hypothetical protein